LIKESTSRWIFGGLAVCGFWIFLAMVFRKDPAPPEPSLPIIHVILPSFPAAPVAEPDPVVAPEPVTLAAGEDAAAGKRDRFHDVARGDFTVALSFEGTLDAIDYHEIKCNLHTMQQLVIESLVDNHAKVKKGDLICKFAATAFKREEERLAGEFGNAEVSLHADTENLTVIRSDNANAIQNIGYTLRDAREALKRYVDQDAPRRKKDLQSAVEAASEAMLAAKERLAKDKEALGNARLHDQARVNAYEKQVDASTKALKQSQDYMDKVNAQLKDFKQYEHPRRIRQLTDQQNQRQLALRKEIVRANSDEVVATRKIENGQARKKQLQDDLDNVRAAMTQLVVRAPADGIVTIGDPRRDQASVNEEPIMVGGSVRVGQIIATIPDLSQFQVKLMLPEGFRSLVKTGMPVQLTSRADQNQVVKGTIAEISAIAVNRISWDTNSPKVYPVQILVEPSEKLMPGTTMRIGILIETVKNAIHVPIEAVYRREGNSYCKVKKDETVAERKLIVGRMSSDYAEVLEGLEAWEQVLLLQPGVGN
jgi:RND family efflux transporter MFP subunit